MIPERIIFVSRGITVPLKSLTIKTHQKFFVPVTWYVNTRFIRSARTLIFEQCEICSNILSSSLSVLREPSCPCCCHISYVSPNWPILTKLSLRENMKWCFELLRGAVCAPFILLLFFVCIIFCRFVQNVPHIYIYIYIYIYIHAHTHTHTYIHTYLCVCVRGKVIK